MEEEAEKMAALKRAYADIILNTSKESAARILVAVRMALGFQQSLFAAKEEAVATMVRLKAVMEDKIREVEKVAHCQEKKIEELELQLGEAEDTIVDLREELKRVREELTTMKDVSVQQFDEGNINDTDMACNSTDKEATTDNLDEPGNMPTICDNMATWSQKLVDTHQCHLQNVAIAEYPKDFSIWGDVPDLCRNGYTQRIHALDHNLTSKGALGETNGLHSYSKCEPNTCTAEKVEIALKNDSIMSVKSEIQVNDALMFEEGCCKTLEFGQVPACVGEDHVKYFNKVSPRKQKALYEQSNAFSDCIYSDKHNSCTLSDGTFSDKYKSHASRSTLAVHDEQNGIEAPMATSSPSTFSPTEINAIEEEIAGGGASTLRSSKCKLDTSMNKANMGIKHCTQKISSEHVKKKQNQALCENEFMQNLCDDVKCSLLSRSFPKNGGHSSATNIQKDLKNIIEVEVALREETENVAENMDSSILNSGTIDLANVTTQTGADKFLKYTFQRKRKRGCSPIKNENVLPEKKLTLRPKSMEKQTSLSAPSKSSMVTDLPRNSRRVVQVARQLISLSEKRW